MNTLYDQIPFGSKLSEPRDLNTRKHRHMLLAIACTLLAAIVWFIPLPVPAFVKPFLTIVIAFLPFCGILVFRYAFFTCLLFVGFAFFRFHEVYPPLRPLRIPLMLSLAVLGVLCYNLFLSRKIRVYWEHELTPFALFAGWSLLGMFFATNFGASKQFFLDTYVKIIIMTFAIAWSIREPKQFMAAIKFFVVAGIIVGVVAIYNKLMGIGLVEGTRVTIARHLRSPLGDPNDLSLRLLFPLSFALSLIMVPKSYWVKLFGGFASFTMIWAIVATQSRGGLLGLLAVLGVIGERYIKSKVVLGGIGGIAAIGLFSIMGINNRSSGGSAEEGVDASAQARLDTWDTAWNMAVQNPIFGVGWQNFYTNYFLYLRVPGDGKPHVVHSTWFGALAENGFIAFFFLVAMIIFMTWRLLKMYKLYTYRRADESIRTATLAVLAGLAGFCVSGTFLTQAHTWSLYLLLALCVALSKYSRTFIAETQEKADDGYYDRPPPAEIKISSRSENLWEKSSQHLERVRWDPDLDIGSKTRRQK